MLVVLDPGFFREDGLNAPDPAVQQAARQRLLARLDDANRLLLCQHTLVVGTTEVAWLDTLRQREIRGAIPPGDRALEAALDRLFREHGRRGVTLPTGSLQGTMWGVARMADWPPLGGGWRDRLEHVLAATALAAAQHGGAFFLCHRLLGRNTRDQSSGGVELVEVLRWRLTVAVQGAQTLVLPCVSCPRHLAVPWTRRMDPRLPDAHDPGLHPYCPPARWMNSQTTVWRTAQSRPCWVDAHDQYWARPATGGGYHWDVYLNNQHTASIGLDQINVTQHGAPESEGRPGDLHHVPQGRRHALRARTGWHCPHAPTRG